MSDYSNALVRAKAFDAKVNADATKISAEYASIVALSIRQGFGAIETTVSRTRSGFNTSDVLVFMKGSYCTRLRVSLVLTIFVEISSDGVSFRFRVSPKNE